MSRFIYRCMFCAKKNDTATRHNDQNKFYQRYKAKEISRSSCDKTNSGLSSSLRTHFTFCFNFDRRPTQWNFNYMKSEWKFPHISHRFFFYLRQLSQPVMQIKLYFFSLTSYNFVVLSNKQKTDFDFYFSSLAYSHAV
jgi:hypothetical protein